MSISASQWGSPLASRRALLVHGLTMCSSSWEALAQRLVAEGFFVIAPNILGHAWRRGSDYRVSALAEDLHPYLAMHTYDVIIGHSLGGPVTLSLLPLLPQEKEVTVILIDPPIELSDGKVKMYRSLFVQEAESAKTVDQCMAESPGWSRRDCVLRMLGLSMCDSTVVKDVFQHNEPWSFGGLFKNVSPNVKITVLVAPAHPKLGSVCHLEHIPHDMNPRLITGVGHCIQIERPDVIMDAISLPRA